MERPCLLVCICCLTAWLWGCSERLAGQSLAELAQQEKLRREAIGPVARRIDNSSHSMTVDKPSGDNERVRKPPTKENDKASGKLQEILAVQGPKVRRQLLQAREELESLEREVVRLERLPPAMIKPGRLTRNPDLENTRRKMVIARRHLEELEAEWQRLQNQARRAGIPPGILRGQ